MSCIDNRTQLEQTLLWLKQYVATLEMYIVPPAVDQRGKHYSKANTKHHLTSHDIGGATNQHTPANVITQHTHHHNGLYHERQRHNECLTHALNAMLGGHAIDGNVLHTYSTNLDQDRPWPSTTAGGPFPEILLNHWLWTHGPDTGICLVRYSNATLTATPQNAAIMEHAFHDTHCTKYMLMSEGTAMDHASALIRLDGTWWHVDSFNTGPKPLQTTADWERLKGGIYTLRQGTGHDWNVIGGRPGGHYNIVAEEYAHLDNATPAMLRKCDHCACSRCTTTTINIPAAQQNNIGTQIRMRMNTNNNCAGDAFAMLRAGSHLNNMARIAKRKRQPKTVPNAKQGTLLQFLQQTHTATQPQACDQHADNPTPAAMRRGLLSSEHTTNNPEPSNVPAETRQNPQSADSTAHSPKPPNAPIEAKQCTRSGESATNSPGPSAIQTSSPLLRCIVQHVT